MKSNQLRAIARIAADNLVKLIEENEEEILNDIAAVAEEAQNQEADKIVFSLAHGIKLDLTRKNLTESLKWNVSKKLETCQALPDPDQPDLFDAVKKFQNTLKSEGASVVIGFDNKEVEITKDSIKAKKK